MDRLLRPRTVAVIGGGTWGESTVRACQRIGFEGDIWPVHPKRDEVAGRPAFRSVADLPDSPDAAYLAVNRELTVDIVGQLAARDAGGAICYATGFSEAGPEGAALEADLLAAAGSMPIIGPNCYGMLNYVNGAMLWPDQQGGRRLERDQAGVAIIAQSSNIAINFTMQKRGLPLSYVFTIGNQALVGISEVALNLLEDPRVSTIGIYIEGFDSVEALVQFLV